MEEESDEEVKANVVNTESAKNANDEVQEQEKNGNYVIYFDFTKFQKKNFLLLISRKNNS